MELRRVERELEALSSEWRALRRTRPRYDDGDDDDGAARADGDDDGAGAGAAWPPARMPPWAALRSAVRDEDVFPPDDDEEEEAVVREDDAAAEGDGGGGDGGAAPAGDGGGAVEGGADAAAVEGGGAPGGYSEFGMCLAPGATAREGDGGGSTAAAEKDAGSGSVWERYAAKKSAAAKPKADRPPEAEGGTPPPPAAAEDDDEGDAEPEDAPAEEVLARLESLRKRFEALGPRVDKFLAKLSDRDPVTKKPRYGEKTMSRVKHAVRIYKALEHGVMTAFRESDAGDPSVISSLRSQIRSHAENRDARTRAERSREELAAERAAEERALAEARADERRRSEARKKRDEEEELARRAEEARRRRADEERRALEAERRADDELLARVPTRGAEGVREQIGRMRGALHDDRGALDAALGALHTLFEQIVRRPEEVNFRRVRRDHPKFVEDIGRHVGGREVLIAAGFRLEKLDGVPCFFAKEPHIETQMDEWSDWFDTLKKTLEVVEEEMLK